MIKETTISMVRLLAHLPEDVGSARQVIDKETTSLSEQLRRLNEQIEQETDPDLKHQLTEMQCRLDGKIKALQSEELCLNEVVELTTNLKNFLKSFDQNDLKLVAGSMMDLCNALEITKSTGGAAMNIARNIPVVGSFIPPAPES